MLSSEWQKSTRSAAQTDCVELRHRADVVQVRDSKLGESSPVLDLAPGDYAFMIEDLKHR
ncbi:DUF397 domain-containing protein [Glycomyces xiaoerkulensis]|uniref:DUF397 domain-containing protein n=1 Tax=Glycomyces xiaoerkulensis TaxID=2038139 RepID=UPI000C267572|nr:DUF397 domain-containing protein [Glycomyces xiaoerkulensis]